MADSRVMENHHRHFSPRHYGGRAYGPFNFFNPTTRHLPVPLNKPVSSSQASQAGLAVSSSTEGDTVAGGGTKHTDTAEQPAAAVEQKWRSRDNRKGKRIISTNSHCLLTGIRQGDMQSLYPRRLFKKRSILPQHQQARLRRP